MKIRRARVDGGESLCAATPENIGRKRCCHIADVASKATLAVITSIALAACNNTATTVPTTTESSMEASIPDGTFTADTVPSETTQVTSPTNETTETTVYVWNGHYYMEGDPEIEGKSVTAMTLSEAQSAGYTSGQEMPEDEKTAYDYNLAWEMVAQGKSDEEIIDALCTQGYSNEGAAQFMVAWVREDYANGIRAYEAPQNTSGNTGSSSGSSSSNSGSSSGSSSSSSSSGNSGSGNGGSSSGSGSSGSGSSGNSGSGSGSSGNSGNSGSGNSGSENSGSGNSGSSTQPTSPAPTETQAPAPTQPAATEPAPTSPPETQAPTPTPVPPTPTPVPPTPTPKPQITGYTLTGTAFTDGGNGDRVTLTFTGSSKDDVKNQFYTYCENHNYQADGYSIATNYG